MSVQIYYTATVLTPDGSDTNSYGEGCEAGHGYTEEDGWIDIDWSGVFKVYPKRGDVRADEWTQDDGPLIEWIVSTLIDRVGLFSDDNGDGTFYQGDSHEDYRTGQDSSIAAHVHGASDAILSAVSYSMAHQLREFRNQLAPYAS